MPAPDLKLPYARPLSLSDPNHDFTIDHLKSILATPDCDLKWDDFQALLGPYLPAGTYEESAYFLPLTFDYILTHDDEALDLVTSLVWFSSEYARELQRDGALEAVRAKLQPCLDHWTTAFMINHIERENYVGKWNRRYLDIVHNSSTLMSATNDLLEFKVHSDIASAFFADLAAADSAPRQVRLVPGIGSCVFFRRCLSPTERTRNPSTSREPRPLGEAFGNCSPFARQL
ncbi:MAG: hypothetical protein WD065_09375 [Planctomycetaceae bacterium]